MRGGDSKRGWKAREIGGRSTGGGRTKEAGSGSSRTARIWTEKSETPISVIFYVLEYLQKPDPNVHILKF